MCLQITFVSRHQNWRCIFIDKVENSENAYQMSCFIAKVREKVYLWFMFQLVSSGLYLKLWQFNTKIDFQHNTKFLIITIKVSTLKIFFFFLKTEFGHMIVIVTFFFFFCHVKSHLFGSKNRKWWIVSLKQILRQELSASGGDGAYDSSYSSIYHKNHLPACVN